MKGLDGGKTSPAWHLTSDRRRYVGRKSVTPISSEIDSINSGERGANHHLWGFASVFLSTGSDDGLVENPAVRDGI